MLRVSFTADDVARTRFAASPPPLLETSLAMGRLRRAASAGFPVGTAPWLREARRRFPQTSLPLLDLFDRNGWPAFLDSAALDLDEGIEGIRAMPLTELRMHLEAIWKDRPRQPPAWVRELASGDKESLDLVLRAMRDLHAAVLVPRWAAVEAAFHADLARRMPAIAAGGYLSLFSGLHPQLHWDNGVLSRPGFDWHAQLEGQGLVLVPSATWTGAPVFGFSADRCGNHVLVYAAEDGQGPRDGTADGSGPADTLAALLGPTRAGVLRSLREPKGTSDLAVAMGVSPATASEHARVLRDVGLVETRRLGRSVRHSLTALGATMLGLLPASVIQR